MEHEEEQGWGGNGDRGVCTGIRGFLVISLSRPAKGRLLSEILPNDSLAKCLPRYCS